MRLKFEMRVCGATCQNRIDPYQSLLIYLISLLKRILIEVGKTVLPTIGHTLYMNKNLKKLYVQVLNHRCRSEETIFLL